MSRRVQPGHANHERWLVSYADFITLMFAFFVVMFAASQADRAKVKRVAESVTRALEDGPGRTVRPTKVEIVVGPASGQGRDEKAVNNGAFNYQSEARLAASAQAAELLPSLQYLSVQLKKEIESGKMRISMEGRGLVVSLRQATFFPSGEDTIDPATYSSLQKVATAICQLPNPVRLEGHTDAVPIHTARFRSNWDLSAARAIAVLELLTTRFNVPLQRLAIAGYAETIPIAANDTEDGRARNRRVDIVILNRQQLVNEPAPAAGATGSPAQPVKPPPAPQPQNSHAPV
ncbi:MAG: OmpA family protein [Acidobacteriia bacterium]|nr:OmpA family protein [Terriglobia bacterium]